MGGIQGVLRWISIVDSPLHCQDVVRGPINGNQRKQAASLNQGSLFAKTPQSMFFVFMLEQIQCRPGLSECSGANGINDGGDR